MKPDTLQLIQQLRALGATHIVVDGVQVTFGPLSQPPSTENAKKEGQERADQVRARLAAMEFPELTRSS